MLISSITHLLRKVLYWKKYELGVDPFLEVILLIELDPLLGSLRKEI